MSQTYAEFLASSPSPPPQTLRDEPLPPPYSGPYDAPPAPAPSTVKLGGPWNATPPPNQPPVAGSNYGDSVNRRKLISNPYRHHFGATARFGAVFAAGLVLRMFDGTLIGLLSWLLLIAGAAGLLVKLFDWIVCSRDTRPTIIDRTGITVTLAQHDTTFQWSQMSTVYLRRHRGSRWLVCTPASNSPLGSDHRTAKIWSQPYNVFFLTSVSGFGDQLVRDALEEFAGERYRRQ